MIIYNGDVLSTIISYMNPHGLAMLSKTCKTAHAAVTSTVMKECKKKLHRLPSCQCQYRHEGTVYTGSVDQYMVYTETGNDFMLLKVEHRAAMEDANVSIFAVFRGVTYLLNAFHKTFYDTKTPVNEMGNSSFMNSVKAMYIDGPGVSDNVLQFWLLITTADAGYGVRLGSAARLVPRSAAAEAVPSRSGKAAHKWAAAQMVPRSAAPSQSRKAPRKQR